MEENKVTLYGLWIHGNGWIKGKDNDPISFSDHSFAKEAAYIIGAKVRRIDNSWKDLEVIYLQRESRSIWHTFRNFFSYKKLS